VFYGSWIVTVPQPVQIQFPRIQKDTTYRISPFRKKSKGGQANRASPKHSFRSTSHPAGKRSSRGAGGLVACGSLDLRYKTAVR
jgi:hypothetical protein